MEEIVLLETKTTNPKKRVFKLQFAIGEFDMVVWDTVALTCKIYEIKHSTEVVAEQYRHLTNEQKCRETEHRFGRIEGKYVIYRGEPTEENGITYFECRVVFEELDIITNLLFINVNHFNFHRKVASNPTQLFNVRIGESILIPNYT